MNAITESLLTEWQALVAYLPRIALAVAIFLLFIAGGRVAGRALLRVLNRSHLPATHVTFFRRLASWAFVLFGLVVALNVLGLQAAAAGVIAGGGVSAVVLGFALRGIGENLLAGLFLAFSRPFELGDVVESGDFQGQVKGIQMRYTHIRTSDGRDVFIPSAQIFTAPLVNYTRDGLRRFSCRIGIDYADRPLDAVALLLPVVRGEAQVLDDPAPAVSVSELLPNYIEIAVAFWVDASDPATKAGAVRTNVMAACVGALRDAGFTLSSDVSTSVSLEVGTPVRFRAA